MSTHHPIVDVGAGNSASELKAWEVTPVGFHGFAGLTTTRDVSVESPEFTVLGHQWQLAISPGGASDAAGAASSDGMVGVFLSSMSEKSIEVDFGFTVKHSDGTNMANCDDEVDSALFAPASDPDCKNNWGILDFAKRSDIMCALVTGTLVIEVRMRLTNQSRNCLPFIAGNPFVTKMRKLFLDVESADIVFEVEDRKEQIPNSRKRTRTSHVKFHAHRLILKQCAPMLAELGGSGDDLISVVITGARPEIFRQLLFYSYGGGIDEDELKSHAKEIIEAANRYAVVNLKLEAEAWYVKSTVINVDNVMEILLFSHAMNCALLKEAVMDFLVDNGEDVLKKVPLKDAPGGLLDDLLAAMMRGKKRGTSDSTDDDISSMRISDLRRKLHERGVDVDGSREALITALKENA